MFHVSTYVQQYSMKMIPISTDNLQKNVLWPPPITARPGRKRRRRLEKKKRAKDFEVNPVLPSFPLISDTDIIRYCTLCHKDGHYAGTCTKPNMALIIQDSQFYKNYVAREAICIIP